MPNKKSCPNCGEYNTKAFRKVCRVCKIRGCNFCMNHAGIYYIEESESDMMYSLKNLKLRENTEICSDCFHKIETNFLNKVIANKEWPKYLNMKWTEDNEKKFIKSLKNLQLV